MLDQVHPFAQYLIHDGACHGTESVSTVHTLITHCFERIVNRVFRHWPFTTSRAGEHVAPMTGSWLHTVQDGHGLRRERDYVIYVFPLQKLCSRNPPLGC